MENMINLSLMHMDDWVIEYSPSQDAFHKEMVKEAIRKNTDNMLKDNKTDYGILGIFSDEKAADNACEILKHYRNVFRSGL